MSHRLNEHWDGDQSNEELENWLNNNPNVETWGYNHKVKKRETPNDTFDCEDLSTVYVLYWESEIDPHAVRRMHR